MYPSTRDRSQRDFRARMRALDVRSAGSKRAFEMRMAESDAVHRIRMAAIRRRFDARA